MKEDLSSLIGGFPPERTLILMKTDYSKIETKILELAEKFGENLPQNFLNLCKNFEKAKLLNIENNRIYLTDNGMLLSNSIITELLECL